MASSMLSGDRRWAATRKSGMTVLGKVPKPINLPSQRLENHGLDPTVEIVPKGTLTWGSRPSSSSPKAWNSSAQSSPNADGSIGSSIFLSGRPSSGGNGRPSTAGSDRSFEPANNAWTSSSRPSSASGILYTNQSSLSRPRSAESRPGSSQLSRFAQTTTENARTENRPSAANSFTLSSGDFPTLGSEKNSDMHIHEDASSEGHPSSTRSGLGGQKEMFEVCSSANVAPDIHSNKECLNAGNMDKIPYAGVIMSPDNNDWHIQHQTVQPYPNMNLAQPHFNSWHGPPVHTHDGVWYRGVPPNAPYRPMGPPSNYHMEPFPYYPQYPARPVPSSQSASRSGAILGGYPHNNGGEVLLPRMASDSYMGTPASVTPIRPGVYPGQVASYDGYYGPRPTLESTGGLSIGNGSYNQHQNQIAPRESGGPHSQPINYLEIATNHVSEASNAHETHGGQYRVLLKPHGDHVIDDANQNRENSSAGNIPHSQYLMTTNDGDNVANKRGHNVEDVEMSVDSTVNVLEGYVQSSSRINLPESLSKSRTVDGHPNKTSTAITSADLQQTSIKKDVVLIGQEKHIGIKPQFTHGSTVGPLASKGDNRRTIQSEYMKVDCTTTLGNSHAATSGGVSVFAEKGATNAFPIKVVPLEPSVKEKLAPHSTNVKLHHSAIAASDNRGFGSDVHSSTQKNAHRTHTEKESHEKTRFTSQNGSQWRKQSPRNDQSYLNTKNILSVASPQFCQASEGHLNQHILHDSISVEDVKATIDKEKIQHPKVNEAKTLRTKQQQMAEEERERTKEQKAKALAKLEELNKRTLRESSSKKKNQVSPPCDSFQKIEDDVLHSALMSDAVNVDSLVPPSDGVVQTSGGICKLRSRETAQESGTIASTSEDLIKNEELATGHTDMHISNEPARGSKRVPTFDAGNKSGIPTDGKQKVVDSGNKSGIPTDGKQKVVDSGIAKPDVSDEKSQFSAQVASSDFSLLSDHNKSITSRRTKFQENAVSKQRQVGERRQNIQHEKKLGMVSPVSKKDSVVSQQCASGGLSVANSFDYGFKEAVYVTMQTNKKNDANIWYQNTGDEVTPVSSFPSKHDKGILENPKNMTRKPLESVPKSTSTAVQASQDCIEDQSSTNVFTPSNQNSFPGENGHGKSVNQWKPLPPRRARNSQSRSTDKSQGTEAVWAPVKTLNKNETAECVVSDTTLEVNLQSTIKNGIDVQTKLKSKRAEMERYVPKVVAKELTKQAKIVVLSDIHKVAPAEKNLDLVATSSPSVTDGSGTGVKSLEMTSEVKNRELESPFKNYKTRVSWRQRNSHKGSYSPDSTEIIHQPSDTEKINISAPPAQSSHPNHEWSPGNSSVASKEPSDLPSTEHVKESKGKHHVYNVNNIPGTKGRVSDSHSQVLKSNDEFDVKSLSKRDSRNINEHARSHWKPKSQVYSSNSCQEGGLEGSSSHVGSIGNESVNRYDGDNLRLRNVEDTTVTLEARKVDYQDASRAGYHATESFRNHNDSLHQEFQISKDDQTGINLGRVNATPHVHAKNSEHIKKAHAAGKDNLSASGDRSRRVPRSGYQKVELQNKSTESGGTHITVNEEPKNNFPASGPSYRERSQNHARRGGNFNMRYGGPSKSVVEHGARG